MCVSEVYVCKCRIKPPLTPSQCYDDGINRVTQWNCDWLVSILRFFGLVCRTKNVSNAFANTVILIIIISFLLYASGRAFQIDGLTIGNAIKFSYLIKIIWWGCCSGVESNLHWYSLLGVQFTPFIILPYLICETEEDLRYKVVSFIKLLLCECATTIEIWSFKNKKHVHQFSYSKHTHTHHTFGKSFNEIMIDDDFIVSNSIKPK